MINNLYLISAVMLLIIADMYNFEWRKTLAYLFMLTSSFCAAVVSSFLLCSLLGIEETAAGVFISFILFLFYALLHALGGNK